MTAPKKIEEIKFPFLDKPVKLYTFNNGHKFIFARKAGELINISSWVRTGSINEDDSNTGVSHFLEHLMFKGTDKYKVGEFDRLLESKGALINAATWKDYTFYYITTPKENLEESFHLHADMMLNSTIPATEVGQSFDFNKDKPQEKRERHVVIEEIRMRDDQPWSRVYNDLNHNMYTQHPYKRDVIGTAEVIASIPRDKIFDYYQKWYTPDNIITIVVGDVQEEKLLELLEKEFRFKNDASGLNPVYRADKEQTEPVLIENTSKINTAFLIMGYHGAKAANIKDTILLDMIGIILGSGKSSRLYRNLIERSEEPVFNMIASDQYQFKDGNTFFIQANFNPQYKERAIISIKDEIQKLIDNPIEDIELKKAKKKLKVHFAEGSETVSEIAESIGYFMVVCGELDRYGEYLEILDTITKDDIQNAAKKYLALNKLNTSILMPEEDS